MHAEAKAKRIGEVISKGKRSRMEGYLDELTRTSSGLANSTLTRLLSFKRAEHGGRTTICSFSHYREERKEREEERASCLSSGGSKEEQMRGKNQGTFHLGGSDSSKNGLWKWGRVKLMKKTGGNKVNRSR